MTDTDTREVLSAYCDISGGNLYTHNGHPDSPEWNSTGYRGGEDDQIIAWLRDALNVDDDEAWAVYDGGDSGYRVTVARGYGYPDADEVAFGHGGWVN